MVKLIPAILMFVVPVIAVAPRVVAPADKGPATVTPDVDIFPILAFPATSSFPATDTFCKEVDPVTVNGLLVMFTELLKLVPPFTVRALTVVFPPTFMSTLTEALDKMAVPFSVGLASVAPVVVVMLDKVMLFATNSDPCTLTFPPMLTLLVAVKPVIDTFTSVVWPYTLMV